MTLIAELSNELRKIEQTRKVLEVKVASLKQKESFLRQLARDFGGSSAAPSAARRPMPEEQRRKISEALKRHHSQSKPV
jgi:hypothetical protein